MVVNELNYLNMVLSPFHRKLNVKSGYNQLNGIKEEVTLKCWRRRRTKDHRRQTTDNGLSLSYTCKLSLEELKAIGSNGQQHKVSSLSRLYVIITSDYFRSSSCLCSSYRHGAGVYVDRKYAGLLANVNNKQVTPHGLGFQFIALNKTLFPHKSWTKWNFFTWRKRRVYLTLLMCHEYS